MYKYCIKHIIYTVKRAVLAEHKRCYHCITGSVCQSAAGSKKFDGSAKLRSMYAKELLKTGDEKDFAEALPIFRLIYDSGTDTDAQKEAACVLAHAYRIAGDINRFFQMTLRDMLSTPCAEICLELGAYFEEAEDYEEASLWYYNAAHETSSILDVHTGGDLPLQGLIRCYEIMLAALPEDDPFAALTANQYEEALADAREALANWDVPEEL